MSDIKLHPTKALNPRLTVCRQCGKDVGVALIGIMEFKDICPSCGAVHYGGAYDRSIHGKKCQRCGSSENYGWKRERIEDNEKLPVEICDECNKLNEQCAEMVREGGIHFRCAKCGCRGAIKASAPIAIKVREQMKIAAPEPCGIEFDDCSQHMVEESK